MIDWFLLNIQLPVKSVFLFCELFAYLIFKKISVKLNSYQIHGMHLKHVYNLSVALAGLMPYLAVLRAHDPNPHAGRLLSSRSMSAV